MNEHVRPQTTARRVVSRDEWLVARMALLEREKAMTRARDALFAERRALPWVKVDESYMFDGPGGRQSLADLFEGRSQLIVYHFMFGPGWAAQDRICRSCAYVADHIDGTLPHLAARDVTLKVVSRAPLAEIEPFHRRMGWKFEWLSSFDSNFNYDYGASFHPADVARGEMFYNYEMVDFQIEDLHGLSVFAKDETGAVFHTYSTFGRGVDSVMNTYNFLDFVPKGRDEDGFGFTMAWIKYHDAYEEKPAPAVLIPPGCCCA